MYKKSSRSTSLWLRRRMRESSKEFIYILRSLTQIFTLLWQNSRRICLNWWRGRMMTLLKKRAVKKLLKANLHFLLTLTLRVIPPPLNQVFHLFPLKRGRKKLPRENSRCHVLNHRLLKLWSIQNHHLLKFWSIKKNKNKRISKERKVYNFQKW